MIVLKIIECFTQRAKIHVFFVTINEDQQTEPELERLKQNRSEHSQRRQHYH